MKRLYWVVTGALLFLVAGGAIVYEFWGRNVLARMAANEAQEAWSSGQYGLAIKHYTRAINLASPSELTKRRSYAKRGLCHLQRAKITEDASSQDLVHPVDDFSAAIELDKSFSFAWGFRGVTKYRQGRLKEAAADLDEALRLKGDGAVAVYYRARICAERKQTDKALAFYERALKSNPFFGPVYAARSLLWEANGNQQQAKLDKQRAKHLADHDPEGFALYAPKDYEHPLTPDPTVIFNPLNPSDPFGDE